MTTHVRNLCLAAIVLTAAVGCQSDRRPAEDSSTADTEAPAPAAAPAVAPEDQTSRALAARDRLFERLSGRLVEAMSDGGPAAAITVCSREAQQIAREVSDEQRLTIGRTSFRLRNPENAPPEWAQQLVADRVADPTFVELPDGHLGALLPIRLLPQCVTCHGPTDQIDDQVLAALRENYPDDQATGFEVDDLRGWFWVNVPPPESPGAEH